MDFLVGGYPGLGIKTQVDDTYNPLPVSAKAFTGAVATTFKTAAGALGVANAGLALAVEEAGRLWLHLNANATSNAIKTGAGTLHTVMINTKGATGNTVTIYDGLTSAGAVIAVIDTTPSASNVVMTYDLAFTTGLTVVIANGTAADVTITYR